MKCKRGDIWWVNFNPARGSEQAGLRPAVIIQNDVGNKYSTTTIVAALTSKISDYPQNVIIKKNETNNLKQASTIKCDQVLTLSQERLEKPIGELTKEDMKKLDFALGISLGLV